MPQVTSRFSQPAQPAHTLPLLLVDGYNVMRASDRYRDLIDEASFDPFDQARAQLIADVAAFAQHSYETYLIFDAAGNLSSERPNLDQAGIHIIYSKTGQSADEVIEQLAQQARSQGRETCVVTSDATIRATVGGVPVTSISSSLISREFEANAQAVEEIASENKSMHLTLASRLSPEQAAKLRNLLRH